MRAHVVDHPGPPRVIQPRELPDPEPGPGWVKIAIEAFGLNRSEVFSRQGHSGAAVTFPRVLGIECVGTVAAAPDGDLAPGTTVAAAMGQMGRAYDGGYAELTVVPSSNVFPVRSTL
ncbi:MAG: hypothetical protein QOH90_906, partial [Actinomycetota bacterium]|nr:hypothetical protein [Actinomycetota bacterium]